MRTLHFDCFSGCSGDMILAALIDLGVPADSVREALASLQLPLTFSIEPVRRSGIAGKQVFIECPKETKHRHLPQIEQILQSGSLGVEAVDLALRIFRRLARAEAAVHDMPIEKVHFHEVGAVDSIADIAGAAYCIDQLKIDRFSSRSVPTGSGTVKCDHGIMPVPAPATAELLKGVPLAASTIKAELTTPTGAAILTELVTEWTDTPALVIEQIGHGAGRRDFADQPNLLRLYLGQAQAADGEQDSLWELQTQLDDVSPQLLGYTLDQLLAAGAVDAFITPVLMKKQRPGHLLTALVPDALRGACEAVLFRETGTLGVRRTLVARSKRTRSIESVETSLGSVRIKRIAGQNQPARFTLEYDDCAALAQRHQLPLGEVMARLRTELASRTG